MIVTTGRIIKIETGSGCRYYHFEKDSETPGQVVLTVQGGSSISLPGNPQEAEDFCKAYMRAVAEEVGYRKQEVE